MKASQRLAQVLREISSPPPSIGTLTFGNITINVPASMQPLRLNHLSDKYELDISNAVNSDNLYFMLQKYLLGQDIFLVSQPGPYARRLALAFASMINSEYEYIALHRDVGETELKQGREIRAGGNLVYVDSPAVRAVKTGRILILEGIEKAERGIMPVLNNLLENREMNLEDGTHIVHPNRYASLDNANADYSQFIPAHPNFRVIAISAPVPPYPGYPLDPPFRSRFQARFCDPLGTILALGDKEYPPRGPDESTAPVISAIRDLIMATQYASESYDSLRSVSKSVLPAFPQTSLLKLNALASKFPPPLRLTPAQLEKIFLTIHPALAYAQPQTWELLSQQTTQHGLGVLRSTALSSKPEGEGLFGYRLDNIKRKTEYIATITFLGVLGQTHVKMDVPCGPGLLRPFPFTDGLDFEPSPRFLASLTSMLQAHALDWNISLIPSTSSSTASASTSTLVRVFGQILGYEQENLHMYKELGGRELVMRREIEGGGATTWQPSPLIQGALTGLLVHLAGLDTIGATAGSITRLLTDREIELWEAKRIVGVADPDELLSGELSLIHPSFRIISTASKSLPLQDWLIDEHANAFFTIPLQPMSIEEERDILLLTGCPEAVVVTLLSFADRYRIGLTHDNIQKRRKLGTRALVRIARRLAKCPRDHDIHSIISRSLLAEFLPPIEKLGLLDLLKESKIDPAPPTYYPSAVIQGHDLVFPEATAAGFVHEMMSIPRFDSLQDPGGTASLIPYMDMFYDNSLQTHLMRDLAIDMELLGEHLVLLGNQGVGKNKIVDRLCQLLGRPREYIQLHRDTTVNQLMFTTVLQNGVIRRTDSPLLRAIDRGRVIVIDEADKSPEHVVAIFRSLAGQGELTLPDGRRVCKTKQRHGDIVVHPNFRLILLANRPGYPFLGNAFLQVLGENFSSHSVTNPDQASECRLLGQLAPEMSDDLIRRLVGAFQELRLAYDAGALSYPYSLRELINLVRHMKAFPKDTLSVALRNIFDFDVYKPETITKLHEVLTHHGLTVKNLGIGAARENSDKQIHESKFDPAETDLDEPKEGEHDDEEHSGGNRWAGGSGGRDTAGQGGRGGYKRLSKGHAIKQVSAKLKEDVPDEIRKRAQEMAREELARRLKELDMSPGEAKGYGALFANCEAHIASLTDLLEHLSAKEEERVWIKRQTDGELDDSRLTEGITGEATVYKRRAMEKPELGRPQIKPKRIRFVFDISGSMYRFQYDGRLERSLETAVMVMESFDRISRKEKYCWDVYGHSGDGPSIPLIDIEKSSHMQLKDRWKVVQKMIMTTQFAFGGDFTVEAIDKAVTEVAQYEADDWFVVVITDANFERYQITPEQLKKTMSKFPKVHASLICIGEGGESKDIAKALPGKAFPVARAADIPGVMRSILSTMVDR